MVASILEIDITQNTNCDNLVSFPKSDHIIIMNETTIIIKSSLFYYTVFKHLFAR